MGFAAITRASKGSPTPEPALLMSPPNWTPDMHKGCWKSFHKGHGTEGAPFCCFSKKPPKAPSSLHPGPGHSRSLSHPAHLNGSRETARGLSGLNEGQGLEKQGCSVNLQPWPFKTGEGGGGGQSAGRWETQPEVQQLKGALCAGRGQLRIYGFVFK